MRFTVSMFATAALITACSPPPPPVSTALPLFGEGYRFKGDGCQRVGESPATGEYLDDAADLVGCPEDLENLGVFVIDFNAQEVARIDGYVLYSVPVR
ncbi:hypothetical protein [Sulfitobacter aestuariivivens]|uniref:Uncharacterized protein n=1 Tax=Sulfitobacter aestuariivivens TaxID=2766981 RepID=A0A927D5Q7_9RHOB|nr:hypothetical protein [Sulfitobacter aestuariivivens]MBD3664319.1 hypothetical protein [Sulfitobacter aestuariivivens]